MKLEIWKDVPNFEGTYQVSNLGRVKSLFRKVKVKNFTRTIYEFIMNANLGKRGYYEIRTCKNSVTKHMYVHRMVALAFIPNPNNELYINHKDGVKTNNNVNNLEWVDHRTNMIHAHKTGLVKMKKGEDHGKSILKNADIPKIRELYNTGKLKQTEIAEMYNCSSGAISGIISGRCWSHIQ